MVIMLGASTSTSKPVLYALSDLKIKPLRDSSKVLSEWWDICVWQQQDNKYLRHLQTHTAV